MYDRCDGMTGMTGMSVCRYVVVAGLRVWLIYKIRIGIITESH